MFDEKAQVGNCWEILVSREMRGKILSLGNSYAMEKSRILKAITFLSDVQIAIYKMNLESTIIYIFNM